MTDSAVLVDVRDHIATITLNRPEAMNAINADLAVGLMDALRRSVQGDASKPVAKAPAPKKPKKKAEDQREMLLPIAGKKKDAPKEATKPAARRKAG